MKINEGALDRFLRIVLGLVLLSFAFVGPNAFARFCSPIARSPPKDPTTRFFDAAIHETGERSPARRSRSSAQSATT